MTEPCPSWHQWKGDGCWAEDLMIDEDWWEPVEHHCPNCCPDLTDPDKDN